MTAYWCERAWLPGGVSGRVRITASSDGVITAVESGVEPDPTDTKLPGITLPGFANAHSHAFHRALRGRTHAGGGTFWTWREQMYAVAGRLDPERYQRLATAVYAEMALAGVTCVGEFHYVHHAPDGSPYDDPNAMGEAIRAAAAAVGIRLTLLDTCYLAGDIGQPLSPAQLRFGDRDADGWAARVTELRSNATTRIGAAIHSVRAVPAAQIPAVVAAAGERPLHVHLSEQPAENEASLAAYGATPAQVLHDNGALGPTTTAVHATHLDAADIDLLGTSGTTVCFCPTTERDLADGIGPARALQGAGARLALGSDQHAVIDLLEEARALEMHERLATQQRGRFAPDELITAMTVTGHAALGWPEAGRLAAGALCDLVAIRLDSPRTAGADPGQVVFAAIAADVDSVIVGGRPVVRAGRHHLGDVGRLLADAIAPLLPAAV
ncbi:MAG TPA: formimidoylglutamate deiminase [Jiangellaceae bacterium]|nr:formimidoylglutamate deiminase [Jiangellaceae bacterium]